jgi:pimeloyl-ACP methyl ester carboxylesterase
LKTILVLHGYTMNAEILRMATMWPMERLAPKHELEFVDAPHTCSLAAVDRFYRQTGLTRPPGPHLTWWDASDDGRDYVGWEASIARLRQFASEGHCAGIIGFSQGAMMAALVAALASRGEFPALRFAVLIAGAKPRARALEPYFEAPIQLPSLHIWGERDALATLSGPSLAQCFDPGTRHTLIWPGGHVFPTRGLAAETALAFASSY